jgi:hypothetical protein
LNFRAALIPVIVYLVIAALSGSASKATHAGVEDVTTFPIQKYVRVLVWLGGLICVVIGAHGILFREQMISSVLFLAFGLMCPFLPLKPVVISPSGVESVGVFPWRGLSIRWNEIERVESWKGARLTAIVKGNTSVAHTRFHVDKPEFIRQLKLHVERDRWVEKGKPSVR